MKMLKITEKILSFLIAVMMFFSSFPVSTVLAADKVTQACSVCQGNGSVKCTANGCADGKIKSDCAECQGTGKTEAGCTACDGSGFVDDEMCSDCSGFGKTQIDCFICASTGKSEVNCDVCNGLGTVECTNCNGAGSVVIEYEICPDCNGNQKVTAECEICSGKGLVKENCSVCNGSGVITESVDCSACLGTGKILEDLVCSICNGTGAVEDEICANCNGNAIVPTETICSDCNGNKTIDRAIDCIDCNSDGKIDVICSNCDDGKVIIECAECDGKGKIKTIDDDSFVFENGNTLSVKVGETVSNPADSTNNITGEITYKSSDEKIATVDSEGNITAKSVGVGFVTITAYIKTDYNYSSKEITCDVKIEKGIPIISNIYASDINYSDAVSDSTISATAKINDTVISGKYIWEETDSRETPSVSESADKTFTAIFIPFNTDDYESVEFEANVKVQPIDITGIRISGTTATYDGKSYNAVTVSATEDGDIIEYSTDEGETKVYSTEIPRITDVMDSTTVYVRVTRNSNYNVFESSAAATINPADVDNIKFDTYNGVYDGKPHKAVEVSGYIGDLTYTYNGNTMIECPQFTEVGEYVVTVNLKNYSKDSIDVKVVISARDITITADDRIVTYNAQPHSANTAKASGLASDDILSAYTPVEAYTTVGLYDINVADAEITRNGEDVTKNYNIIYVRGSLNIKPQDVIITINDIDAIYTALPHPSEKYDYITSEDRYVVEGLVSDSHKVDLDFNGEATKVGTYNSLLTAAVNRIYSGNDDVTENYDVTIKNGILTIKYPEIDFDKAYYYSDIDGKRDWYQNDITIYAEKGYQICYNHQDSNAFSDSIIYSTEGVTKPEFAIKEMDTGYITDITKADEIKLDKVNPEAYKIQYDSPFAEKIFEAITFGIYKPETIAVIKGTDSNSKIYSVTYTIKEYNLKTKQWNINTPVEKTADADSIEEFTFNVPFSGDFRGQIEYFVTDTSGRVSTTITDSYGIIVDSVKPDEPIITVDKSDIYASKDTFADDFSYHISVSDDNSGIGDVVVKLNGVQITEDINGKPIDEYYNSDSIVSGFDFKINTSQLEKRAEDGVYNLDVFVYDNADNMSHNSYEAYIDVYAPMINEFTFKSNGNVFSGDEAIKAAQDNLDKEIDAEIQNKDIYLYNYYFEKNTFVTVYACDYDSQNDNKHTAGISDIKLIAESAAGENVVCTPVSESFVQTAEDGIGYSAKTFLVKGPFKGNLYALAEDYSGNYPTNSQEKGFVLESYKSLMSEKYEGYVNPYSTILEDLDKHKETSSILINPLSKPVGNETYNYSYRYKGTAERDVKMDYTEKKVPLYSSNVPFSLTINDSYSGIREISWSIVGKDNQDSKNNQSGTVKVNNLGVLSGDSDGWSKTSEEGSNLVTSMTKNIVVRNNSNDIVILVELTDRSGNKSYDYYVLGIDKTNPDVSVSVSGKAENGKYFNTDRTITVVVKERNFNPSEFDLIMLRNNSDISVNGAKSLNWKHSETDSNATDSTTHTATYTISNKQEGDYKLSVKTTDRSQNKNNKVKYSGSAPTEFVIDSTKPKINVSMSGMSANEKYFFNTDRTVTIVVTDRNFNPNDVALIINGSRDNRKLNWKQNQSGSSRKNTTTNTASFTISAEGDYTFAITCNDLAENNSEQTVYATDDCERFTIDKTAPTIVIGQMVYQSANNGKNANGEKVNIPITVTVNDANIGNMYNSNAVTSKEVTETLNVSMLNASSSVNSFIVRSSSRNSIIYSSDNLTEDGIYTLNLDVKDCAGNPARIVAYPDSERSTSSQSINGTTGFFTFSVNRNGSTYSIDKNTKEILNKYYIQHVDHDVVIYETNVNELNGDLKSNVIIKKDGVIVDATDYIDIKNSSSSSWQRYIYTIKKEFFEPEGEYSITIESKDKAGNNGYSSLKMTNKEKLIFVVDRTLPIVTITGVTDDKSYTKESQHVKVSVSDDVFLAKIQIIVNGEIVEDLEAKDFGQYYVDGQFIWEYDFMQSSEAQKIEVKCWDAANNSNIDTETEFGDVVQNFMVSTKTEDIIKFWIVNNVLNFVIICVVVISVLSVVILLIISKRRKKNNDK